MSQTWSRHAPTESGEELEVHVNLHTLYQPFAAVSHACSVGIDENVGALVLAPGTES
jgi:hypothetical protein